MGRPIGVTAFNRTTVGLKHAPALDFQDEWLAAFNRTTVGLKHLNGHVYGLNNRPLLIAPQWD